MTGKLAEYIKTGAVSDTTPPPAPFRVSARRDNSGQIVVTWHAHADLESGIKAFVVERDGQRVAQVPEKPVNSYGRPLFQGMTYHDTPQAPWPAMRYIDKSNATGPLPVYGIRTINSVHLVSKPTTSR